MKGNEKVLTVLNDLLSDELTAISQYMVHSEMCVNWGYGKLHDLTEKRAIDEMKHAEKMIGRILYLEGQPVVSKLKAIKIGADVEKQMEYDRSSENDAIVSYNAGIKLVTDAGDNGSKILLESILSDEERHIDDLETMQDQVKQMGLSSFLLGQK